MEKLGRGEKTSASQSQTSAYLLWDCMAPESQRLPRKSYSRPVECKHTLVLQSEPRRSFLPAPLSSWPYLVKLEESPLSTDKNNRLCLVFQSKEKIGTMIQASKLKGGEPGPFAPTDSSCFHEGAAWADAQVA